MSLPRRTAAVLPCFILLCTLVLTGVVATGTAYAANPETNRVATWNMQVGRDRWQGAANLARDNTVLALQEVPNEPPAGARYVGTIGNTIDHYEWDVARGVTRSLFILYTTSRNLGMVTAWMPNEIVEVDGPYRPALMVTRPTDDVAFASIHAAAGSGFDVRQLVENVAHEATGRGLNHWAVAGDFNRDPSDALRITLPPDARVYNSGQATQRSGNELDYMISNVNTEDWQATVHGNQGSDHWPVSFTALRAGALPPELTIHADNSDRLLDVFQGDDTNGTHVITYHDNGAANQRWRLQAIGTSTSTGHPMYRIMSSDNGKCLDVNRGQQSGWGDYLNIWDCHDIDGVPGSGGNQRDTQNFTLEHPNPRMPNLTMLRNNATGLYANIAGNNRNDGAWVVQWGDQWGNRAAPNESFYLHPLTNG